ncbi:MAG: tRNA preQ1(34) S-adenosylmethionine ribosyltransferase-isomerase QueA [Pseudomonadota bacterium]
MQLAEFDYRLSEDKIALRPARPRDSAKLLFSTPSGISDHRFRDLPRLLRAGDHLVLNDTKVVPSRLKGIRRRHSAHGSGVSEVELTLIERKSDHMWNALAKPAKRLNVGDMLEIGPHHVLVRERDGGVVTLEAATEGALSFATLEEIGTMPLPPYIAKQRATDDLDSEDYQTVFASNEGAVAAPTASLHFTDQTFQDLKSVGVQVSFLTLHVGAGTFLPVTVDDIDDHKMHAEWYDLPDATAAALMESWRSGGRVIPVGTTALRCLESAATGRHQITGDTGETDIFIKPGYDFKASDGLITNFHLPKSTLLMLVGAFIGMNRLNTVYDHALSNNYRFFSYGDSSLILPS